MSTAETQVPDITPQFTLAHKRSIGTETLARIRGFASEIIHSAAVPPSFALDLAMAAGEYYESTIDKSLSPEVIFANGLNGQGEPLVLVGGFGTGDFLYSHLRGRLRGLGFRAYSSGIKGVNWGNFGETLDEVKEKVDRVTEKRGEPAVMLLHSLGGAIGRVVAHELPGRVRSLDAVAAPLNPYPDRAINSEVIRFFARKGFLGIDKPTRARLIEAFSAGIPEGMAYRSYIPRRGMVLDLQSCRDPQAQVIEGAGESHVGALFNSQNLRAFLTNVRLDRQPAAA